MQAIQNRVQQFNDGLLTSRELLGFLVEEIGQVWNEGSNENETENIAKLAQWLATKLG